MHPFKRAMHWASERKGLAWIDVSQIVEAAIRMDTPLATRLRASVAPSALPPIPQGFEPHHQAVFTVEARGFLERVAGRVERNIYKDDVPDQILVEAARFDLGREALAVMGLGDHHVEEAAQGDP